MHEYLIARGRDIVKNSIGIHSISSHCLINTQGNVNIIASLTSCSLPFCVCVCVSVRIQKLTVSLTTASLLVMDDYPMIESAAADTTSGPSLSVPVAKRGRLSSEHMASDSGFVFPQPGLVEKSGQRGGEGGAGGRSGSQINYQ